MSRLHVAYNQLKETMEIGVDAAGNEGVYFDRDKWDEFAKHLDLALAAFFAIQMISSAFENNLEFIAIKRDFIHNEVGGVFSHELEDAKKLVERFLDQMDHFPFAKERS